MPLWTNVDNEAGKPKYLNATDKAATLGISADEAVNVNGTHAGWVLSKAGSGGREGRTFRETLVAMGSMTGDNDSVDPDPVITIGTQPQAVSVAGGDDLVFTVAATATRGAALGYQWQVSSDSGSTFANITGATAATLTVEEGDAEYVTLNEFRVIVSATGADSVTSDAVAATITYS
jgi:hypothetical protein